MKSVEKAIWYIESHSGKHISLDELAEHAGVSRYHLSRTFSYALGIPLSRYIRDRRLSKAATVLAEGRSDILDLALSLGYGSHEAFSRAFKSRFQRTPESIREQGHTNNLELLEAHRMENQKLIDLGKPRVLDAPEKFLVGLSKKHRGGNNAGIPEQWREFRDVVGNIDDRVGNSTFGVVYNIDDEDNFDYLCGVEVESFSHVSDDFSRLTLPGQRYAVFEHTTHVSGVQETCKAIWTEWLPNSGQEPSHSPFFERYGQHFDPESGNGGLEIWLPIK